MDFAGETAYTVGMEHFFTLEEDLPANVGFTLWGGAHIAWLCIAAAIAAGDTNFEGPPPAPPPLRQRMPIAFVEMPSPRMSSAHANVPLTAVAAAFSGPIR